MKKFLWALCFVFVFCGVSIVTGRAAQAQTVLLERPSMNIDRISDRTLLSAPLSELIDSQRQKRADALLGRQRPLFFVSAFLQIAMALWLWRSGRAAALRDGLRRRIRSIHGLRFAYVSCLALIIALAALPAAFVTFRDGVVLGLSVESPAEWLGEITSTAIVNAILAGIVFSVMLALAQATRLWYLLGAAFLVGFILLATYAEPVILSPWLRTHQLLPDSPLADRLQAIETKAGIGNVPIVIERIEQEARTDVVRVHGFGPTAQIVISDTLLRDATPNELAFAVARASVHIARGDVWRLSLYITLWLIVAAAVAVTISDRIGFRRDDDPLSRIALLGGFLGLAILFLLPVVNAYSRRLEARADAYAIALTHDTAGAVRLLVRSADANLLQVCPPPPARRYFLTYPPVGTRIGVLRGTGDPCL